MTDQAENIREIICPKCGGEGMWESAPYGYSHIDGHLLTRTIVCEVCDGSGGIWIDADPINMDDLAEMSGDDDVYSAFAYRGGNP